MARTLGPTATTSAHARRFDICAVAGIRMPPDDLRSPSAPASFTRTRSLSILIGSFSLFTGPTAPTVPSGRTNGDAGGREHLLCGPNRVLAEVEDRRGENGVGAALGDPFDQVVERADSAAGDHRDVHGVAHRPGQLEVEAVLGAVAVHRGEQ